MKPFLTTKLIVLTAIFAFGVPFSLQAETEDGNRVVAHVEGMVCDFCAQGLLKALGREDSVKEVKVDLDASTLTVVVKEGQALTTAELNRIISDNGFTVSRIDRQSS